MKGESGSMKQNESCRPPMLLLPPVSLLRLTLVLVLRLALDPSSITGHSALVSTTPKIDKTSTRLLHTNRLVTAVECQTDSSSCYKYMQVPYAQPPLGALRFKPPEPVTHLAERQSQILTVPKDSSKFCLTSRGRSDESEDCLYMDIYRPRSGSNMPLTVMVNARSSDGTVSARHRTATELFSVSTSSVVAVINVRGIGPQGLFMMEGMGYPGNLGVLDLKVAIDFLLDNREQFGLTDQKINIVSQDEFSSIAFRFLLEYIEQYNVRNVLLFGGEPLRSGSRGRLEDQSRHLFPQCAHHVQSAPFVKCIHGVEDLAAYYTNASRRLWQVAYDESLRDKLNYKLNSLGALRNTVRLFHGVRLHDPLISRRPFVPEWTHSGPAAGTSYGANMRGYMQLWNDTVCLGLSGVQCTVAVQEYLPTQSAVLPSHLSSTMETLSEALFDKHVQQFHDTLRTLANNFDTFAYLIEDDGYIRYGYRGSPKELQLLMQHSEEEEDDSLIRDDFLNFISSAINHTSQYPMGENGGPVWEKYQLSDGYRLLLFQQGGVRFVTSASFRPRASRFWQDIIPMLSESSLSSRVCSPAVHTDSLREHGEGQEQEEAYSVLSQDAELKMAILLGSTALLGSMVFVSCILLIATRQQLRRIKMEAPQELDMSDDDNLDYRSLNGNKYNNVNNHVITTIT